MQLKKLLSLMLLRINIKKKPTENAHESELNKNAAATNVAAMQGEFSRCGFFFLLCGFGLAYICMLPYAAHSIHTYK